MCYPLHHSHGHLSVSLREGDYLSGIAPCLSRSTDFSRRHGWVHNAPVALGPQVFLDLELSPSLVGHTVVYLDSSYQERLG